jgi:hexosaminidase
MKKFFVIVLLFKCFTAVGQNELDLVPRPAYLKTAPGTFTIDQNTKIYWDDHVKRSIEIFNDLFFAAYGFKLQTTKEITKKTRNIIKFSGDGLIYGSGEGSHGIEITGKNITIGSGTESGRFYGIQTLFQLIDLSNHKPQTTNHKQNTFVVPQIKISDYPRFPYRGVHLDVCRHFFTVSFIKKYIDYLATYKLNKFHWHLTEDQGWRIEIKKYPLLTTIGANRNGTLIGRYPGKGNDNKPYGGYYTQAQIREVIDYAASRYIEVIPEIEMPGHGSAAIAAYPWLSCFPNKPTEIPAKMISQKSIDEQRNGRIKLVQETWGVFDDIFCAGKDSTFRFLENVIDEVAALFPSKYFHMGGDEAPKTHWKQCPACQQRMKDNNLKDEHELQSWFVRRIEKYVNSKGKILIGWDEILEGGLAPNAVVMSWRGEAGGIEAARQKHNVIMSPGNPLYFDHTQSKNEDSVTFGGYNPIENVYAYDPVPKVLTAEQGKYILGAQANMWTEYQNNTRKIEYQLFPRLTALSEVLWSPKEKRDWKDFERRLPVIFERLDRQHINYSKAYYDLKASVIPSPDLNGVRWKVETKNKNGNLKWTQSAHSSFVGDYIEPLVIKETTERTIYLLTKDNKQLSSVSQSFSFNKATGKKITLVNPASDKYPADGAFTLVNGVQNVKGMLRSSEFLGFLGKDMEAVIDLGTKTNFTTVIVHSLSQPGSWIYEPASCHFMTSDDGVNFREVPGIVSDAEKINNRITTMRKADGSSINARYIKVVAKNYGIIPQGKPGAATPAWLFVDEIEVN